MRAPSLLLATLAVVVTGCAPRWTSPRPGPIEPGRGFVASPPAGWGVHGDGSGMIASLHGPPFEQVVAGWVALEPLEKAAIERTDATDEARAAIAAATMRRADAWGLLPHCGYARVLRASAEALDGRPGLAFDGEGPYAGPSQDPTSIWPPFLLRARVAVVGDRAYYVGLCGARRVHFAAALPAFERVVQGFRIDAPSGDR